MSARAVQAAAGARLGQLSSEQFLSTPYVRGRPYCTGLVINRGK